MKKKLLLVVLCLLSVSVFAQTKKKAPAKKPTIITKATNTPPPVTVDTIKNKPQAAAANKPAEPAKPFDRPVDGYYKKVDVINARVTPYANLREADVVM